MTHAERILSLLGELPGLDDDEIAQALGIEPRQTVNQTCRLLASQGVLIRERGSRGKIINRLAGSSLPPSPKSQRAARGAERSNTVRPYDGETLVPADLSRTLIILPCSGAKKDEPISADGGGVERYLPGELAVELRAARESMKARIPFDERTQVPAFQRYDGTLYRTAREAITSLMEQGAHERQLQNRPYAAAVLPSGWGRRPEDSRRRSPAPARDVDGLGPGFVQTAVLNLSRGAGP